MDCYDRFDYLLFQSYLSEGFQIPSFNFYMRAQRVEGLLKMNGQELFKENIEEFGIWGSRYTLLYIKQVNTKQSAQGTDFNIL